MEHWVPRHQNQHGHARRTALLLSNFFVFLAMALASSVQVSAKPFQRNDRINIIVGYEPGGGYDVYGRFVGRFLGKHLAGQPNLVVQNMPGAGSLRAANHIYNIAPKDGTTIGIVGQSIPMMQLLEAPGILFDADRFVWLGRLADLDAVLAVWSNAGVRSVEDLKSKEVAVAVGGALSGSELYPIFLNKLVGTRIKSVRGYSVREQMLALERGEIDGSFGVVFSQINAQNPSWISDGRIQFLIQIGLQRRPSMPDVPTLAELATNENNRRIMMAISGGDILGRAFIAPPDTESGRAAELRKAFEAMTKDAEVLEAAAREKVDINPLSGEETQALVQQYKKLPPEIVSVLKQTILEDKKDRR